MGRKPLQQSRIAKLTTPLGADKLVLTRFDGDETLSGHFRFNVEALSTDPDVNFDQAIGRNCTISLETYAGKKRYFDGILTDAQWLGMADTYYSYRLELRPWFWLLTKATNCKIFQNMKAPDIIKEVFQERGFSGFSDRLSGTYDTIEYCVQYRETDFDFVSRLMEKYGIYYYFEHSDGNHTLVLADSHSSHKAVPGLASVKFLPRGSSNQRKEQHITEISKERRFRTGKIALKDYNYLKPKSDMKANSAGGAGYTHSDMEVYDYPGAYDDSGKGNKLAKFQIEAEQALDKRRHASGEAPSLFAGGLISLEKHPAASENCEFLIVKAHHSFAAETYRSGGAGGGSSERAYMGHYEFQVGATPYREPAKTPRPIVYGPQTAMVVGPAGEEIYTDEHGRIKVQFHWDRKGKNNEKSSLWIRIGQVWSGKNWGGIYIPRIGMEVIVEFLEGDPDSPLVTGTVYNGDYKTPYELPGKKNIAGVKSQSTKGGSTGDYNEYIFDDTKGKELIRVHGQKDQEGKIENDDTWEIGNDQKITVKHDQTLEVKNNQTVKIGADQKTTVGNTQDINVKTSYVLEAGTTIKIKAGLSIKLEASGSSIEIGPAGIVLNGTPMIKLN